MLPTARLTLTTINKLFHHAVQVRLILYKTNMTQVDSEDMNNIVDNLMWKREACLLAQSLNSFKFLHLNKTTTTTKITCTLSEKRRLLDLTISHSNNQMIPCWPQTNLCYTYHMYARAIHAYNCSSTLQCPTALKPAEIRRGFRYTCVTGAAQHICLPCIAPCTYW